ncbi:DUF485 domain-containing protein [Bacillus sp. 1NLA3E]|uniref:DUF485 domain-containing protein n=1 Tax=Bacillus sp. 1NLA3E TaxID=666686 RepID=UPI000247F0CB|nr:DUF485 domain-containing protein [Bacillus sp. 1NLA3E]AGK54252.1 hypothetical protein B1NLA3E_12520 [Bacillus sp. 1NLA3E]
MAVNEKAFNKGFDDNGAELDYSKIVKTASFQKLLRVKRGFIVPMSIFFLVFYFTLPVLTAYSDILNQKAFGDITWAWVFGSAQFIMTWSLCGIYSGKARKFDQMVEGIIEESQN